MEYFSHSGHDACSLHVDVASAAAGGDGRLRGLGKAFFVRIAGSSVHLCGVGTRSVQMLPTVRPQMIRLMVTPRQHNLKIVNFTEFRRGEF